MNNFPNAVMHHRLTRNLTVATSIVMATRLPVVIVPLFPRLSSHRRRIYHNWTDRGTSFQTRGSFLGIAFFGGLKCCGSPPLCDTAALLRRLAKQSINITPSLQWLSSAPPPHNPRCGRPGRLGRRASPPSDSQRY